MLDYLLLGADIGTTGSKGVLLDEKGQVVASSQYRHGFLVPKPGWVEHDAERVWWGDFCRIVNSLLGQVPGASGRVAAVGCCGLAPAMLPVDRAGKAIRPAILYGIDTRTTNEIYDMNRQLGLISRSVPQGRLTSQSVGPKILWFKRNEPDLYRMAWKVFSATNFLVYRLTGEAAPLDHATGQLFAPFYDRETGRLRIDLLDRFEIEPSILPDHTVGPGEIVGYVSRQASAQTGLMPGVPVIAGMSDAAAAYMSLGGVEEGDFAITYGTTICLAFFTRAPLRGSLDFSVSAFPAGDFYMISGANSNAGSLVDWLARNIDLDIDLDTDSDLAGLAESVPVCSDGLIVLPYFNGERSPIWDERARGAILGLTLYHTKAHIYRAFLEGICFTVRHSVEQIREMGAQPTRIVGMGGGTRNRVWTQMMCDIIGLPQVVTGHSFGGAIGAAYQAGVSAGICENWTVLRHTYGNASYTLVPSQENYEAYTKQFRLFREAFIKARETLHYLAMSQELGQPAWAGP